jgi:16S rRNA (cytidine1402-2'-O)-methyltransferase
MKNNNGILYVVATPIGNLGDITMRALEILGKVDYILCEDTRETKVLLDRYKIDKKLISYHQHSKITKADYIIQLLLESKNLALVSDAGTPSISDPGRKLVEEVEKIAHIQIVPIPGPSAIVAALSVSGLNADKFTFLGFLPTKKGRNKIFEEIKEEEKTVVFYESVYRIIKTLSSLDIDDRKVVVCRELTKMFEETVKGTKEDVLNYFENNKDKIKGEFVVIIEGKK